MITEARVPCFLCCFHDLHRSFLGYQYLYYGLFSADVTEPLLVEVDRIYHLACPASPIFYKHNPVKVCILVPTSIIHKYHKLVMDSSLS